MISSTMLPFLLKQLRLGTIRSKWQEIATQAEQLHWTYSEYLAALCDQELASREQRRIQKNIIEAKLPIGKRLDTFIFCKAPTVNAAQITAFAENTEWISNTQNLIIFGPSGVGKTHLAAAIGRALVEQGVRVLFTKTTTLVQKLQAAHKEHKLAEFIAKLAVFRLIILDDIGYVKKNEAETSVLFEFITDRYESGSLLITANQSFEQWDEIFPNTSMTVAAIDRIIHHVTIIDINEASYRKASKLASLAKEKNSKE